MPDCLGGVPRGEANELVEGDDGALTAAEVREALEPRANVEIRATRRGPAPHEVLRMTEARRQSLQGTERRLNGRRATLRVADRELRAAVAAVKG